jgi:hypothetical protein
MGILPRQFLYLLEGTWKGVVAHTVKGLLEGSLTVSVNLLAGHLPGMVAVLVKDLREEPLEMKARRTSPGL